MTTAPALPVDLDCEDFMIPSGAPGIDLFVRNKRPAGLDHFAPARTLLFVHGATYPAETQFDLALGGFSWMDHVARRGFDVYLVDVRGYGRSTRPAAMDAPADQNPPFATTDEAAEDVDAAVDFIRHRRGIDTLCLIGWSWGTATMGLYATRHAGKVDRLVLYAPVWTRNSPSLIDDGGPIGAYRIVEQASAHARWVNGVPAEKLPDLIPPGWFAAWLAANFASDPVGARSTPPVLRAPNGVVLDSRRYWSQGIPPFEAAKITVPILVIVGEWDQDTPPYMAQTLFPLLVNAPRRRLVMIGEATHTVALERNRMQLFGEVQNFLEE